MLSDSSDLNGFFLTTTHGGNRAFALEFSLGRWTLRSPDRGSLYGAGGDVWLLRGFLGPLSIVGGVQAGIGTRDASTFWGSWSAGAAWSLLHAGPLGVELEGRYRELSQDSRNGIDLAAHVRIGFGGGEGGANPRREARSARADLDVGSVPTGKELTGTAGAVVRTALAAMGAPYQWGGTSENGFDCSGLIYFAYLEHGVALPRRSAEQATTGVQVSREMNHLEPGDILTFATNGGSRVTHVGLYVGDGRFIHSATGGVQVSRLSADDPYGAWWFRRWVGARRILP